MDSPISRNEHNEFAMRIDEENRRQNRRIELLEKSVNQIGELTSSIRQLATNMKNMLKEQEKQGKCIEVLESRDGEKWRKVTSHVTTAVISIVIGYIFAKIGIT